MMKNLSKNLAIFCCCSLLFGCDKPPSSAMGTWLGDNSTANELNYAQVVKGARLRFPDDHKAHNDFRHEWWYFTANLVDQYGQTMGLQWTQFRFATAPEPSQSAENVHTWKSQQIYMAHSAVTTKSLHYADEKWSRHHEALAGVETSPLRVFLDDWQWRSQTSNLFPAHLQVKTPRFSYSLNLRSSAPYQKQGEQGYSKKNATGDVASYYYSQPFIEVSGEVIIDGKPLQVNGKGWIDREWSSAFLLDSQQGWDWFALRLSEQSSLVLFQLRDSQSAKASYAYGRIMQSDGTSVTIKASEISLQAHKQTKIQGRDYPTTWRLKIDNQKIDLTINALNPLAKMPLSVPYWEGPVTIQGSHAGTGYMELTGY